MDESQRRQGVYYFILYLSKVILDGSKGDLLGTEKLLQDWLVALRVGQSDNEFRCILRQPADEKSNGKSATRRWRWELFIAVQCRTVFRKILRTDI
jgi:hypothetical protein